MKKITKILIFIFFMFFLHTNTLKSLENNQPNRFIFSHWSFTEDSKKNGILLNQENDVLYSFNIENTTNVILNKYALLHEIPGNINLKSIIIPEVLQEYYGKNMILETTYSDGEVTKDEIVLGQKVKYDFSQKKVIKTQFYFEKLLKGKISKEPFVLLGDAVGTNIIEHDKALFTTKQYFQDILYSIESNTDLFFTNGIDSKVDVKITTVDENKNEVTKEYKNNDTLRLKIDLTGARIEKSSLFIVLDKKYDLEKDIAVHGNLNLESFNSVKSDENYNTYEIKLKDKNIHKTSIYLNLNFQNFDGKEHYLENTFYLTSSSKLVAGENTFLEKDSNDINSDLILNRHLRFDKFKFNVFEKMEISKQVNSSNVLYKNSLLSFDLNFSKNAQESFVYYENLNNLQLLGPIEDSNFEILYSTSLEFEKNEFLGLEDSTYVEASKIHDFKEVRSFKIKKVQKGNLHIPLVVRESLFNVNLKNESFYKENNISTIMPIFEYTMAKTLSGNILYDDFIKDKYKVQIFDLNGNLIESQDVTNKYEFSLMPGNYRVVFKGFDNYKLLINNNVSNGDFIITIGNMYLQDIHALKKTLFLNVLNEEITQEISLTSINYLELFQVSATFNNADVTKNVVFEKIENELKVGEYFINFSITENNEIISKRVKLILKDTKAPVVTYDSLEKTVLLNSSNDFISLFSIKVSDLTDVKIELLNEVSTKVEGTYVLHYKFSDQANNVVLLDFTIHVKNVFVSGIIYDDQNYDSTLNDSPKKDVKVFLIDALTLKKVDETISDSEGKYKFSLIHNSSNLFYVKVDLPIGYIAANKNKDSIIDAKTLKSQNLVVENDYKDFNIGMSKDLIVNVNFNKLQIKPYQNAVITVFVENGSLFSAEAKNININVLKNEINFISETEVEDKITIKLMNKYGRVSNFKKNVDVKISE